MNTLYNITYDLPVNYKKLKIYPVKVKDMLYFNVYSHCLTIDKNSIPNPEIIAMTYLEYIYSYVPENTSEGGFYILQLDRLLSLCLKEDDSFSDASKSMDRYGYTKEGEAVFEIKGDMYNSDDFDEIKKIIAKQNMLELVDEDVSKEVRDSLEKAKEYMKKLSGEKNGSLEDYMVSLSIFTGWDFEYIMNMTIRKFIKCIRRMDALIHYKIYVGASVSGFVNFKDKSPLRHWMRDLDDEDKYENVSIDYDEMQNKISFESAKTAPQE